MIVTIDPAKRAVIDARNALEAVDAWFTDQVAAGYTTPHGWKLGLAETDVTLLTGAFVLAKEAVILGAAIPPIIDKDGVPHTLTIEELTNVMLGYGQYRAALSSEYNDRKAAVTSPSN